MGVSSRLLPIVGCALAGLTVAVTALPLRSGPHASAVAAAAAAPATCPPFAAVHPNRLLPSPPQIDTWTYPNHTFTMHVRQGAKSGGDYRYCYVRDGDASPYVDAPTIRVRQGDTFTMILTDDLPPQITSPQPMASAPDGCALLDYEPTLPAPSMPGYLGHKRIVPNPSGTPYPEMMHNDTNFHTHGWHVDPNVDNVFKSMAMTPANAAKKLAAGACSFTFTIPDGTNEPGIDPQTPGTYWYHAHLHMLANNQVGGGLAGALIVLPKNGVLPYHDTVLLVEDAPKAPPAQTNLLRQQMNVVGPPHLRSTEPVMRKPLGGMRAMPGAMPGALPQWPSGMAVATPAPGATPAYCPSGDSTPLVVNGLPVPHALSDPTVPKIYQQYAQAVYRVLNVSSNSYLDVQVYNGAGRPQPFTVVGRDGVPVGRFAANSEGTGVTRTYVFLPPSGRVDILLHQSASRQTIVGAAGHDPFCTGYVGDDMPLQAIAQINPVLTAARGAGGARTSIAPAGTTAADKFAKLPAQRTRYLTFTQYTDVYDPKKPTARAFNFYVTETDAPAFVEQPFWLQTPPPGIAAHYLPTIRVPRNSIERWHLIDATAENHAFHIHQLTFVTLSSPFEPSGEGAVFQDSVAIPSARIAPGQTPPASGPWFPNLVPSDTLLQIDFRGVPAGLFVYHCHMLFHEDHGMMGIIEVY